MFFVWLVSLAGMPVGLALLIARDTRRLGALLAFGSSLFAVLFFPINDLSRKLRLEAFGRLGERLTPLVEAVERYHNDRGEYPETLENLVPEYLHGIPETNMGNYKVYRYERVAGQRAHAGNPWLIVVRSGYGMSFDAFMYYPLQNYEKSRWGTAIERLGDWGYLHE